MCQEPAAEAVATRWPTCRPTFPAGGNIRDAHATVNSLAHVVNRQQADRGRSQGLHLDTGPAMAFGGDLAVDCILRGIDGELRTDAGQCDRVTERNQVARPFRRLDRSDPRDAEDIPSFAEPDWISARVAGFMKMLPAARATREVSALLPTSTICAWPLLSKWVRV